MPTLKPEFVLTEEQLLADIRAAMIGRERPDGYHTVSEWAERLQLPVATVSRYLRDNTLPGYAVTSLDNVTVIAGGKRQKTTVYKVDKT